VFVNAPLEICARRGTKGLHAKARAREIKEFTGLSAPYEPPSKPELVPRTDQPTMGKRVARVLNYLEAQGNETAVSILSLDENRTVVLVFEPEPL
jgi:adenylylsulfate kinase-like enzyme